MRKCLALAGDCFWLLDVLLLFGGMRSTSTSIWRSEHFIRLATNCLFAYQVIAAGFQLKNVATDKQNDVLGIVVEMIKFTGICACCLRSSCVAYFKKSFETFKNFIIYESTNSGNIVFDELERHKFQKYARLMLQAVFGLIISDTILLSIPCTATRNLIGFPVQFSVASEWASRVLQVLLVISFPLATFPKFTSSMASNVILLLGMRAKLNIVAHRYRLILNRHLLKAEHSMERLDLEVRAALIQQIECWRHLSIVKDTVGKTFIPAHYYSVYCIGSLLYVSQDMGINATSGVLVASVCFLLLEHYFTCRLIDSLRDVTDSIGYTIFQLCAQIPYSRKHHSKFIRMKRTLIIAWINTCNATPVNCFQLFELSTSAFVRLLNTTYSVFTFLIDVT
ncbi:AAEL017050-PA [Aedes aegypti]|uniref:AAEL017050-PA n=2 Tax=Aedes aegypti TaxID=7159 RepID=A0A1S7UEH7_AEDAE|nr:AAEL017050-PA [Aedes aegypti]DAA80431.1 TPA_exp: odorant receptor 101 [Aedes aegypti]